MAEKKRILVIDDDPAICESVKAILDGNGFDTKIALSGKDGVDVYRSFKPDVVLCDMMMEHIDEGAKVAKIIKEENKNIPVFLLSSIGDATASNIGLSELGFSGVFQKPVNFDLLLSVIGRFAKK